jgi:hypothetical protein
MKSLLTLVILSKIDLQMIYSDNIMDILLIVLLSVIAGLFLIGLIIIIYIQCKMDKQRIEREKNNTFV